MILTRPTAAAAPPTTAGTATPSQDLACIDCGGILGNHKVNCPNRQD
jgi:hypothetical protein